MFKEDRESELAARRELIRKALVAWVEIFPHQSPIDDQNISKLEQGLYVVGERYPLEATFKEPRLTGVRLGYSDSHNGMWLYANDYHGDPAPLLIQLAQELKAKGIEIVFINRQGAYDAPDPEATKAAIDRFNSRISE